MHALDVDKVKTLPDQLKARYLGDGDWVQVGVHADGSCFFHSLACIINYQVPGLPCYRDASRAEKQRIGLRLRSTICQCFTKEAWTATCAAHGIQELAPGWTRMRDDLKARATWANYWIILFTLNLLNLNGVFYDIKNDGRPYCGVTDVVKTGSDLRAIVPDAAELPDLQLQLCTVLWLDHCHFEAAGLRVDGGDRIVFLHDPESEPGRTILAKYYDHGTCQLPEYDVPRIAAVNVIERDSYNEHLKRAQYVADHAAPFLRLLQDHDEHIC